MYSIIVLFTFLSIKYIKFCEIAQYIVNFLTMLCVTPYKYAKQSNKLKEIIYNAKTKNTTPRRRSLRFASLV